MWRTLIIQLIREFITPFGYSLFYPLFHSHFTQLFHVIFPLFPLSLIFLSFLTFPPFLTFPSWYIFPLYPPLYFLSFLNSIPSFNFLIFFIPLSTFLLFLNHFLFPTFRLFLTFLPLPTLDLHCLNINFLLQLFCLFPISSETLLYLYQSSYVDLIHSRRSMIFRNCRRDIWVFTFSGSYCCHNLQSNSNKWSWRNRYSRVFLSIT